MNFNTYPDPWDLRYFQEIAVTANLSRASERLGVGQPALSLSLKRLESALDVKLFLRRNRGLELTAAGQRLLRETNQLLSYWDAVVAETKKSKSELKGRFLIGAHPSVAIYALAGAMRDLYAQYPGIEIQLVHGLSREIAEKVISGSIDFGLVVNPVAHPELVIQKLATDQVCFWKSTHGLTDVLIFNPALAQSQDLLKKIGSKFRFKRTLVSENLEVIAGLAQAGAGVAILPSRVAASNAPALKRLEDLPHYSDQVTFVYRADLPKIAATRVIMDHLKRLKI